MQNLVDCGRICPGHQFLPCNGDWGVGKAGHRWVGWGQDSSLLGCGSLCPLHCCMFSVSRSNPLMLPISGCGNQKPSFLRFQVPQGWSGGDSPHWKPMLKFQCWIFMVLQYDCIKLLFFLSWLYENHIFLIYWPSV